MCMSPCTCVKYGAGQCADSNTPLKIILHKSLQMSLSVNVTTLIPHTAARNNNQQVQIAHKPSTDACEFLILNEVCEEKEQFYIKINELCTFRHVGGVGKLSTKDLEHIRKKKIFNIFGQAFIINPKHRATYFKNHNVRNIEFL